MNVALMDRRRRQADIDPHGHKPRLKGCGFQRTAAFFHGLCQFITQAVKGNATLLAFLRRHFAQSLEQPGQATGLAKRGDTHGIPGFQVRHGCQFRQNFVPYRIKIVAHGTPHEEKTLLGGHNFLPAETSSDIQNTSIPFASQ